VSLVDWSGPPEEEGARFPRRDLPELPRRRRSRIPDSARHWGTLATLAALLVLVALMLSVFVLPDRIVAAPPGLNELTGNQRVQAETALEQTRNGVRTTLVQAVGGGLLLLTFAVGLGQVIVTREGQLVDRFTKTIEQLGSSAIDVRLGAIHALRQIARRPRYARPIAEILVAYLKTAGARSGNAADLSLAGQEAQRSFAIAGPRGDTVCTPRQSYADKGRSDERRRRCLYPRAHQRGAARPGRRARLADVPGATSRRRSIRPIRFCAAAAPPTFRQRTHATAHVVPNCPW